jgi:hypothetical protein
MTCLSSDFASWWAVRNQLSLGTLKIARVPGLTLSRRFLMAYPAGPEPTGMVGIFRTSEFRDTGRSSVLISQACLSRHLSEMMDRIAKGPEDVKKSIRAEDELR